ncbi:unnamed protein product, partial [Chrysoparadoxa australica]
LGTLEDRLEAGQRRRHQQMLRERQASALNWSQDALSGGGNSSDGPGEFSLTGQPRHDNDKASIREIQVLPTAEELLTQKGPYLPTWKQRYGSGSGSNTHATPHSAAQLLDAQFRLLRQDFLIPIKRAAQALLASAQTGRKTAGNNGVLRAPAAQSGKKKESYTLYVFEDVRVESLNASRAGVSLVVSFALPPGMVAHSTLSQLRHWE